MLFKYLALCAPFLITNSLAAQVAPTPLPQPSFSAPTVAGVRLGSRAELPQSQGQGLGLGSLRGTHGAPDATIEAVANGFVLRDTKSLRTTFLGTDIYAKLPAWASDVAIPPSAGHSTWLYKRAAHAMGFSVDRLGFVDAMAVAGSDPGAPVLQAEGIAGGARLGDDFRAVLRRFGYPSSVEGYATYASPVPKPQTKPQPNEAPKIFELRYTSPALSSSEDGAALAFTVRGSRVVRFYAYRDASRPAPSAKPRARFQLLRDASL